MLIANPFVLIPPPVGRECVVSAGPKPKDYSLAMKLERNFLSFQR
jgi:hypothetical protein